MSGIDREDLERDFFISQIMIGNCPKCGSGNTHDCESPFFSISEAKELEKMGSECGIAREINDNKLDTATTVTTFGVLSVDLHYPLRILVVDIGKSVVIVPKRMITWILTRR